VKIINAVKFIFPGISENERTARAVVSAFLVQLDPTVEELADIRTAVSEAVTNAIVHGYISSSWRTGRSICASKTTAAASQMWHRRCSRCLPLRRRKNVPGWALPSWKALWTS
jgi:hypothetical protein